MRDADALDWMWYLWIGMKSPASGRLVKTFERAYIDDPASWVEPMDPYFELTRDERACDAIMAEFGLAPGEGTSSTATRRSMPPRASSPSARTAACW